MLNEIKDVRQVKDEGIRRWFTDTYFDLIVWYDYHKNIEGFQLCYDKEGMERAVTWRKSGEYLHNKIDAGEDISQGPKQTPVLVADGAFDYKGIAERFIKASTKIDKNISRFVYQKLMDYN